MSIRLSVRGGRLAASYAHGTRKVGGIVSSQQILGVTTILPDETHSG
jgi:hypothetical protein